METPKLVVHTENPEMISFSGEYDSKSPTAEYVFLESLKEMLVHWNITVTPKFELIAASQDEYKFIQGK